MDAIKQAQNGGELKVKGENNLEESAEASTGSESDSIEDFITDRIGELAMDYGHYGYRMIAGVLRLEGHKIKILNVIDEYTLECLISYPARRIRSGNVIDVLRELFLKYGTPEYIRSDNGSGFIAKKLREWLELMEIALMYILQGSPWENGFCESFNGTMANELLHNKVPYMQRDDRNKTWDQRKWQSALLLQR